MLEFGSNNPGPGLGQTATVPMVGVQQGGMVGVQQGGMVGVQQGGMVGVQATTPVLQVVSGVSANYSFSFTSCNCNEQESTRHSRQ